MRGSDLVKQLGALRDGLLVSSSIVYLLGYLTWSSFAWRNHLGPVSALDAQYFAAGLPIALGLLCTFGSVIALRHITHVRWQRFVGRRSYEWRRRVFLILVASTGVLTVVSGVVCFWALKSSSLARILVIFALLCPTYTLVALVEAMRPEPNRVARVATNIVFGLFGGMVVAYFALALYPSIPVSFGGGRPRLVVLDIQTSSVTPETLRMLLPPSASIPRGTVMRTRELDLITTPGPYYLIGIPSLQADSPPARLQLERSTVAAVIWTQ